MSKVMKALEIMFNGTSSTRSNLRKNGGKQKLTMSVCL